MRRYLPMWSIHSQMLTRGAVGCAQAQILSNGIADASAMLWERVITLGDDRTTVAEATPELDGLALSELTNTAIARLKATSQWSDPAADLQALRQRLDALKTLLGRGTGPVVAAAQQIAATVVLEAGDRLRDAVHHRLVTHPESAGRLAGRVKNHLLTSPTLPADGDHLRRFANIVHAWETLLNYRGAVARATLEQATALLAIQALTAHDDALNAVARDLVLDALYAQTVRGSFLPSRILPARRPFSSAGTSRYDGTLTTADAKRPVARIFLRPRSYCHSRAQMPTR